MNVAADSSTALQTPTDRAFEYTAGYTMTAIDTDVRAVQKMFDVNVFGPMRMIHHFHDMLIRSSGVVVNIGSIGGVVPYVYGGEFPLNTMLLVYSGNRWVDS